MPFKLHGKTYYPVKQANPRSKFSTFRFKPSKNGKAYLMLGKLKHPVKIRRGPNKGKLRRWALYEVLEA